MASRSSHTAELDPHGPPRASLTGIIVDTARHLVPLVPFYAFDGSIGRYILLTAFDLSIGLLFIVATTRERGDVNSVDPRSRWLVLQVLSVLVIAPFLALAAAIIAIPVGLPAYLVGIHAGLDWPGLVRTTDFWEPVAIMSLLAAVRYQVRFYERTSPGARGEASTAGPVIGDLEGDRRRSLADKAAQVTLLATFAVLCYLLIVFGRYGLNVLPILYAALLVFYDARPDLARRILPALWQER